MISSAALSQLIHRLRNANARYAHIALLHRSVLRCTYHAKRRARWSGLHIDILKAQNCPSRHVSLRSLPVIDADPQPVPEKPAFFVPSMSTSVHALGLELTNLPEIVVSSPTSSSTSLQHQLQRLTVRVPPLRLNYAYPDLLHMHIGDGSVPLVAPGAPRLKPMQLPDEDGVDAVDACVGYHPLSSGSSLSELMTPNDDINIYGGLRIVVPSRCMKRKIQDVDSEDGDFSIHPRIQRVVKARWSMSNAHTHRDSMPISMMV